jgi:hypothetical protein
MRAAANLPPSCMQVLVDESTQATKPECLLPMTLSAQQVLLVGDHCQLGPVVMNKQAERCSLSQSLVERMILCGVRRVQLQARPSLRVTLISMHVAISVRETQEQNQCFALAMLHLQARKCCFGSILKFQTAITSDSCHAVIHTPINNSSQ